ncbi:hypothetical protein ACFL7M_16035 [Thermodesulfobacteriota bacterium]
MKEGNPIACRELKPTIPKRTDGSEIEEYIIDVQCEARSTSLESAIFHDEANNSKSNRIDQFFSGCPEIN